MNSSEKKFCLDANVLIQAWQKYYAPSICPSYWDILDYFGKADKLFIPELVYEEIATTEDDLSNWLKSSNIPIRKIDEGVTRCLQDIYSANPNHKFLVDNTKQRSIADPWVIAHAIKEGAVVVTKEVKVTALNSKKIKIPNVCDNMKVNWINDFQLVNELGLVFKCEIITK
ncbi:MAG: DUF4411 family protein [Bacteroidales bacterium]